MPQLIKKVYELIDNDKQEVIPVLELKKEIVMMMKQTAIKMNKIQYDMRNKQEGWDDETFIHKKVILSREFAEYQTMYIFMKNFFAITDEEFDEITKMIGVQR